MARPRKPIDPVQVEALAAIGCTLDEMASILSCHRNTLLNRFCKVIEKGKSSLRMSLRREQVRLAKAGDRTMLIWLGKQYLGQSERHEVFERKIDYASLTDEELEALASAESIG
jgi:hypothetical protein